MYPITPPSPQHPTTPGPVDPRKPFIASASEVGIYTGQGSYEINKNCEYSFKNGKNIQCRHLATMWLIDRLIGRKVDFNLYKDEAIVGHVRSDTEEIYHAVLDQAELSVTDNKLMGQHFVEIFRNMEARGETESGGYINSTGHAMGFVLSIDTDQNGQKKYSLAFYDPNSTATHVAMAHSDFLDLSTLATLGTKDLLGEERDTYYFGDTNTCALSVFDTALLSSIVSESSEERPIKFEQLPSKYAAIDFTFDTIDTSHVFHLLAGGCDQNLRELMPVFQYLKMNDSATFDRLIRAEGMQNRFGLGRAMASNYVRSLTVYAELLKLVPPEQRAALLTVVTDVGLANALKAGDTDIVSAFKALLVLIPEEQRAALLENLTGSGLAGALQNGHIGTIKAYQELFALIPSEEQRVALLANVTYIMLGVALQSGQAGVIDAYMQLFAMIPAEQRADFLAKVNDGEIASALQNGQADVIKNYKKLFAVVPPGVKQIKLLADLTGKGIGAALRNGHPDAIAAYKDLLTLITPEQRAELLSNAMGDGLGRALKAGNTDAIKAFKELLALIPVEQRADLLADATTGGIGDALQHGHAGAIRAYKDLFEFIPENKQCGLLDEVTGRGLQEALQSGHADAISALGELFEFIHPDGRADLLEGITAFGIESALEHHHFAALSSFMPLLDLIAPTARATFTDKIKIQFLSDIFKNTTSENKKAILRICLQLSHFGTPGALRSYTTLTKSTIPPSERRGLKDTDDTRTQFLFSGNQEEAQILFTAFRSATVGEQREFKNMLREFGLLDNFIQSMGEHYAPR